jgi:ecotropic viral integration site 5 protein
MVFRIFDHVLATGVDAIFSFSVLLLQKNEQILLNMSFDQILEFLKSSLLDCYKVDDGFTETSIADHFRRPRKSRRMEPRKFLSMLSFGMPQA